MGVTGTSVASDERWMREALRQAQAAAGHNEIPVGAVVVIDNEVIGAGHNCPVSSTDPTAHAEIQALRDACNKVGNYRLPGATLYATLEPCLMCAGAILQARLCRVVFGARDEKAGAVGSTANLLQSPLANHQCEVKAGVLGDESTRLLQAFFAARRVGG
ncbi:MAG: tRNA adenosine(34) deaminase TadA [Arenicellales bacterium]